MAAIAKVRFTAVTLVVLALLGGLYLWAVRGEALLYDLATGVRGFLCL